MNAQPPPPDTGAVIPVTVIGGYLGAGKTSLINRALRGAGGRRLAILVNDFGDTNIDADLIEGRDGEVWRLSGGCVCCEIGSDMVGTLMRLAAEPDRPDQILIETSGVALPASVAQSLALVSGLSRDLVIVAAAADQIERQVDDPYVGDTVRRQLAQADLLVPTRLDLLDANRAARAIACLRQHAPAARIVLAAIDNDAAAALFDPLAAPSAPSAPPVQAGRPPATGPAFWQQARWQAPDGHSAGALFASQSLQQHQPVDLATLVSELTDTAQGVLRAKGVLRDLHGTAQLLQVAGTFHQWTPVTDDHPAAGRLLCIGLQGQLSLQRVRQLLETP